MPPNIYPDGSPVLTEAEHKIAVLVALLMGGPQGERLEDALARAIIWAYSDAARATKDFASSREIEARSMEQLPPDRWPVRR